MKILVCSSYFWPELTGTAPYVTAMARYLAEGGHEVTVISGHPHYPDWRSLSRRTVLKESLDEIVVHRRPHYIPRVQSAGRRAIYEATMTAGSLTAIPAVGRPDVVVGMIPSLASAITAATAARVYRVPFGLIVHDVMGRAAAQSGVRGGTVVAGAVERCESALARRADRLGVIAESFRGYFLEAGVNEGRIQRLRTWALGGNASAQGDRATLGWPADDFVCLHAGNMGHKQGLDNLIRAAALPSASEFRFVLAGEGNERARLERTVAEEGIDVSFLGPQAEGDYQAMLGSADVLLVNQRASAGDMSLPSKLTSYFAAGKPVVAAVPLDGETAHEVRAARAGVVVAPDDPGSIVDAIGRLRADRRLCLELGANGRRFAEANLTGETALPAYRAFVERIAGAARR